MDEHANLGPGGYGPPPGGGGYGPPPGGGGYGAPPPGGGGYGGAPPGGGGYGGPPPGGFGGGGGGFGPGPAPMGMPGQMGGPGFVPQGTSNGLAIAAMICGIGAIPTTCCCSLLSLPLAIAACVLGGIALSKVKAQPQAYGGKGMALAGLICGVVGILMSIAFLALGFGQMMVDQYNHSH